MNKKLTEEVETLKNRHLPNPDQNPPPNSLSTSNIETSRLSSQTTDSLEK